jgi:hypothetical protein
LFASFDPGAGHDAFSTGAAGLHSLYTWADANAKHSAESRLCGPELPDSLCTIIEKVNEIPGFFGRYR